MMSFSVLKYAFYRVPKLLFTTDRFWNLSTDAKMLYGLLLDRMSLSQKNGWVDEQGRVYIIYTIEYLLASIYNAPYTIGSHYDAKVRHDETAFGGR